MTISPSASSSSTQTVNRSSEKTSSSSTEQKTVTTETTEQSSSTEPIVTPGVDLAAIEAGDFSSLSGTWVKADGQSFTFDQAGLVSDSICVESMRLRDGYLMLSIRSVEGPGFGMIIIPAGVNLTRDTNGQFPGITDQGDDSRDRLIAGQSMPEVVETSDFFTYHQAIKRNSSAIAKKIEKSCQVTLLYKKNVVN